MWLPAVGEAVAERVAQLIQGLLTPWRCHIGCASLAGMHPYKRSNYTPEVPPLPYLGRSS